MSQRGSQQQPPTPGSDPAAGDASNLTLELDATEQDRKLFLEETTELLQLLDEDLVRLEQEDAADELLQEIFRAAHTIKGSAAVIGHHRMAELTHAMETLLDLMRKGSLAVTTAAIDALLQALDLLRVLNQEVETLQISNVDITSVVQALESLAQQEQSKGSAPSAAAAAPSTQYDHPVKVLRARLAQGPWAAVRALQVLLEVGALTTVIESRPSQAEIEQEKVSELIEVVVPVDADDAALRQQVELIPDIEAVELTTVGPATAAAPAEAAPAPQPAAAAPSTAAGSEQPSPVAPAAPPKQGSAPAAKAAAQSAAAAARAAKASKTVRIDVERLDNLLNLVGELVIDRTRLNRIGSELEARYGDEGAIAHLIEASQHIGRITDQLQEEIMKSRMLPIETVFNRLPRVVRDLAVKMGKRVELRMSGQETELDRSVIEEIGDPLIHILRNCVDHGIEDVADRLAKGKPEQGHITITATHQDNYIVITVEDDGKGIDPQVIRESAVRKGLLSREAAEKLSDQDAVQLIFAPGLSTAKQVSDVSGRGVGMDIVRTNIEKLSGSVDVVSKPGVGTQFIIRLPLTLAIIQALLVTVGQNIYAIPIAAVNETLRVPATDIRWVNRREVIQLRGEVLPLLRLRQVFDEPPAPTTERNLVVAVRMGGRPVGLVVDSLIGEQEIVIKPLGGVIGDIEGISGAAILGDGRVALIVDVASLLKRVIHDIQREAYRDEPAHALARS